MNLSLKSKAQKVFLGIEFGETTTRAALAQAAGTISGVMDFGLSPTEETQADDLFPQLMRIKSRFPVPTAIGISVGGPRGNALPRKAKLAAARVWPGIPCAVTTHLEAAWLAAKTTLGPDCSPVVLFSGVSSGCFARSSLNQAVVIGSWGRLLGDKGSGFEIGLRALKAVLHYYDQRGDWPDLGSRILCALSLNTPESLIHWSSNADARQIAQLSQEVFRAKDKISKDILAAAAASLARDAAAAWRRAKLKPSKTVVVLAGDNFKHSVFLRLVKLELGRLPNKREIRVLENETASGAAEFARQEHARTRRATISHQENDLPKTRKSPLKVFSAKLSPTERRNPNSMALHRMAIPSAIRLMLREEQKVSSLLLRESAAIQKSVKAIAYSIQHEGRLFYVGSGTSGRLGVLDASECPPTFRTPPDLVQGIIAGGQGALWRAVEGSEDDALAGEDALAFRGLSRRDVVVGIAASGTTPFVWGALGYAKKKRAKTILICFNPWLEIPRALLPDIVIKPNLGPEVLTGSTRLKAGTATKLLLNIFTTLAMVRSGKVVSNLMVDLLPGNVKLRDRAARIVQELTGVTARTAQASLRDCGWRIKEAVKALKKVSEKQI
jgi:N-acetylmuramic acid 6-phosphate etherase